MLKTNAPLSDSDLVERVMSQNEEAFERLYERYYEAIFHHLNGITQDKVAAQDLAQDTLLLVWTRASQWQGKGRFKAWLYRAATNLALNYLRAQRRHPAQPLVDEDEARWDDFREEYTVTPPGWLEDRALPGPGERFEQSEQNERIRLAAQALSYDKREVFRLVHEMELSIRDTAARLGIPEGTVKSRLYHANKQFNQAWKDLEPGEENL
jgi:RNA polymerase sigma-70 factor, ECF subfamily